MKRWGVWVGFALMIGMVGTPEVFAEGVYSDGGWSTLHQGPANRKLVQGVKLAKEYRTWSGLKGAAVLTAPTLSPDGSVLYVSSGRARGHSNLFAYALDGGEGSAAQATAPGSEPEPLWQAAAWTSPDDGVDPCAILSSPIVDQSGDIYIGDCNQLFAYRPNGELKWVVPLPPLQETDWSASEVIPVNALTTAVFTKEGFLFGVTNFGDIVIVDRETGKSLIDPQRLPGHLPELSDVLPMPKTTFGEGLVDPEIREWAWQLLVGGAMRSANTPAVDFESGRIFVAATSTTKGMGALYGLDLNRREGRLRVDIAFSTDMGIGSGSSPALSPEADRVYVSDEEGHFYSVDARTGETHWRVKTKATSAAAAVGADGVIYTLQANGPALIAIRPNGEVFWESDLAALAKERLPRSWILGAPVAIGNGNPTVVGDRVLVPVVYGYALRLGRRIPLGVESSVVAVDAATGIGVSDVLSLEDDSTGITAVLPNGVIINSLGTAMTSGLRSARSLEWILPGKRRLLEPLGGFQVSWPVDSESF